MKQPKVTLMSWTKDPIQTISDIWQKSREEKSLADIHDEEPDYKAMEDLFVRLLDMKVPVMENIDLVFMLENVSISFREQMVRHRIGVKVGERLGCDLIPGLTDSSWWSQSMRILDMSKFCDNEMYITPDWIRDKPEFNEGYIGLMHEIQEFYKKAVEEGCPREQAREVFPLGSTHSISWKLNISSLLHIIGKRGCWILQLGYWGPIIEQMINECSEKIHPAFRNLVTPPCIKNNEFTNCLYHEDNKRRLASTDHLPPCSLYVNYHNEEVLPHPKDNTWTVIQYESMQDKYRSFWNRDPNTGKSLK